MYSENRKTASQRPFRNPIRCFDQAAASSGIRPLPAAAKQAHHPFAFSRDALAMMAVIALADDDIDWTLA